MIRIALVGDIGSGKTYVAKQFNFPVFNADKEVVKLYKSSRKCFNKLHKAIPKYIFLYPVQKSQILKAILGNKSNLKKIVKIIHPEIRRKMNVFLNKNKNKKIVVLDIPLFLENRLNEKKDILIFVDAKKNEIFKRLKQRPNFNIKLFKLFKKMQISLEVKKKKSNFILKNNFTNQSVKTNINKILKNIKK